MFTPSYDSICEHSIMCTRASPSHRNLRGRHQDMHFLQACSSSSPTHSLVANGLGQGRIFRNTLIPKGKRWKERGAVDAAPPAPNECTDRYMDHLLSFLTVRTAQFARMIDLGLIASEFFSKANLVLKWHGQARPREAVSCADSSALCVFSRNGMLH